MISEDQIRDIIRQTARETVKQLRVQGMIKDAEDANYKDISEILREYYRTGEKDSQMTYALLTLRLDPYFQILEKYYKNGEKIESIAQDFGVDNSTIVRKKRELCLRLYYAL